MENPFISVHRKPPENPPTILVQLRRAPEHPRGRHFLAWTVGGLIVLTGLLMMWRTLRRESGRRGAAGPTDVEPSSTLTEKRESIHLLIRRAMRTRARDVFPIPVLKSPEAEGAGEGEEIAFDFSVMRGAETLRRFGQRCLGEGRRTLALLAYARAVGINPNSWKLWENIGQWYLQGGDYETARQALETALRLGGYSGEGLTLLAAIHRRDGRLQYALDLWDWSRKEARGHWPQADLNEGLARIEQGDDETAIRCLARYVEREPGDAGALRALAYAQSRAGFWMDARQTLRKALTHAPADVGLHADAAAVASQTWLVVEAMEHLETLVDATSAATVYAYMQWPAFEGFRKTELGRKLQSVLMVEAGKTVVSPEEVDHLVALDLAPRFDVAPGARSTGRSAVTP